MGIYCEGGQYEWFVFVGELYEVVVGFVQQYVVMYVLGGEVCVCDFLLFELGQVVDCIEIVCGQELVFVGELVVGVIEIVVGVVLLFEVVVQVYCFGQEVVYVVYVVFIVLCGGEWYVVY